MAARHRKKSRIKQLRNRHRVVTQVDLFELAWAESCPSSGGRELRTVFGIVAERPERLAVGVEEMGSVDFGADRHPIATARSAVAIGTDRERRAIV